MQSLYEGVALFLKKKIISDNPFFFLHIYIGTDIEKLSNLFFRKGSFWGNTRWLREVRNLLINIFILSNQSHTQPLNSQDTSILGKQNLFPIQNFSITSSSVTFIEGTLLFRGNFLCSRICPVKSISRIRFWYRIFVFLDWPDERRSYVCFEQRVMRTVKLFHQNWLQFFHFLQTEGKSWEFP